MDAATILKVAHALLGVWLVAGLVGRWVTLAHAARSTEISAVNTLLRLSDRFEQVVIRGSLLVLVLGIATAIVQGRPFLGPLQGARIDWLFASLVVYLSIIPLIPFVFLPRGRAFAVELEAANAEGRVTERLAAAFRDPVVFAGHVYELIAIVVVFVLMIAKPF
jgi:hypothetical protein